MKITLVETRGSNQKEFFFVKWTKLTRQKKTEGWGLKKLQKACEDSFSMMDYGAKL